MALGGRCAGIAVVVLLFGVFPAIAASPKKGGVYRGVSSGVGISLYLSKSGKKLVRPSSANPLLMKCSDGDIQRGSVEPLGAQIKKGKFDFKGSEAGFESQEVEMTNTVTMTGTFKKKGRVVSGKVRYLRVIKRLPPAPAETITCDKSASYTAKLAKKGSSAPPSGR
jgi:hypothetical protein